MRLASVEVIPYALPFKEPYVTARGSLTRREMVLLRIRDEDGFEGLGEAVPLSLRGGVTIETVVRELEAWRRATSGPRRWRPRGVAALSLPGRCALTTALLDHEKRRGATTSERASGAVQRDAGHRRAEGRRRGSRTLGGRRVRDVQAEGRSG